MCLNFATFKQVTTLRSTRNSTLLVYLILLQFRGLVVYVYNGVLVCEHLSECGKFDVFLRTSGELDGVPYREADRWSVLFRYQ